MDKLMEHTLARQNRELNAKVDRLAEMLERQLALVPQGVPQMAIQNQGDAMVNTGPIQVNNTNNTLNIVKVKIIPWARDGCLNISAEQMAAAFRENARLAEYAKWPEHELTDPEKASPFISELFMDLIKRAHADPASRNVYLNPKRSDQVLVCVGDDEHWEVLPFDEATRVMHDGVKRKISVVILTNDERNKVPLGAQNALSLAGLMYEDEPEAYVKRARVPMAAHLATLALQASAPKIVQ
jgi:phosphoglycolate phosphatase-like HAD superfamily hydrolase